MSTLMFDHRDSNAIGRDVLVIDDVRESFEQGASNALLNHRPLFSLKRYEGSGARILPRTHDRDLAVLCCNTYGHCPLLPPLPGGTRQSLAELGHKLVVRDGFDFPRFDLPISFDGKSQSFVVFDLCWQ